MNLRHAWLIAVYSLRYSLRSGIGLVFLLVTLVFGLLIAHYMVTPAEQLITIERSRGVELTPAEAVQILRDNRAVRTVIKVMIGATDGPGQGSGPWLHHLLEERPALLSAILLILIWGWPFVISLGAFNLFSGDVQSRGIRFHLMRTSRSSLYVGRMLGMLLSQSAVLAVLLVTIVAYIRLRLHVYDWGSLLYWGGAGLLMLTVLAIPYVALCAWISAAVDSPFASLVIVTLIIGAVPLVSVMGTMSGFTRWLLYLLPWGVQQNLHHPSLPVSAGSALACLGYAAAFGYFGLRHFCRRDL